MKKSIILSISIILILLVLIVYWPVQHYEFLRIDDQVYVTDNDHVRSGLTWENVQWAFTSLEAGFWQPMTWLSLMLDTSLYSMNAGGFHWTNVLLHIGSTFLLFITWRRMTGAAWQSGVVAALFAVHPLNVEPVAWIASRKDVLCGFWGMMALWSYAHYVEKPGVGKYLSVWLSFILGLMSKPMLATLPLVMLLLDYWPLARFETAINGRRRWVLLLLEKLPLALCSMAVIGVTFIAERRIGAFSDLETISFPARVSNALVSYLIYIEKMIIPTELAIFYPHPGSWPLWTSIGAGLLIIVLALIAVQKRKEYPYFFVGWFWYLITLLPVIGFIQLGTLARADRYAYIPLIGLFIAITWGSAVYLAQMKNRQSLVFCSGLSILLALVVVSRLQVAHWKNDLILFQHTVSVTENNYKAYHALGMAFHQLGNDGKAIENIRHSISLKADQRAHLDLGAVLMSRGQFKDAEKEFLAALKLDSDNPKAHNNLGAALASQGNHLESIDHFQKALSLDPQNRSAADNLRMVLDGMRSTKEGIE